MSTLIAATAEQATEIHKQAKAFVLSYPTFDKGRLSATSAVAEYIARQRGLTMFYYKIGDIANL